jgi:D-aspartate ligase
MSGNSKLRGVLILGGSYGALAVARSVGRHGIAAAYLGERYSVAHSSRYIGHASPWESSNEPDPLEKLLGFADEHQLDGWLLLPCADFEVQFIAKNHARLAERFQLVTMDWSALEPLNDKSALYRLAETIGIGHPQVYEAGIPPADIAFPVVLKPISTETPNPLTRAKGWRAENAADFAMKLARAESYVGRRGLVVQQLIPGSGDAQLSYAALWDNGREVCSVTARRSRQYPLGFGTSPFVESVEIPDVSNEARRLLGAVGYHGLVEVEFKRDPRDGSLKLLDVNTRVWAWIGLGEAMGVDFPYLAALVAAGEPVPALHPPRYGPVWRRPIPNALSVLHSVLQDGQPGYAAGRSVFARAHSAVFCWDDLRPVFAELPTQIMRAVGAFLRR